MKVKIKLSVPNKNENYNSNIIITTVMITIFTSTPTYYNVMSILSSLLVVLAVCAFKLNRFCSAFNVFIVNKEVKNNSESNFCDISPLCHYC